MNKITKNQKDKGKIKKYQLLIDCNTYGKMSKICIRFRIDKHNVVVFSFTVVKNILSHLLNLSSTAALLRLYIILIVFIFIHFTCDFLTVKYIPSPMKRRS